MGRNRDKIRIVKKRNVDKIMEEKKVKLSTVIIFLLLIVIIAGGVYIYKLQAKETKISNKPSENTNTSINEEIPNKTTEDKDVVKNEDFTEQEKFDKYMQTYKESMKEILEKRGKDDDVIEFDSNVINYYSLKTYNSSENAWIELDKNGNVNLGTNKSSKLYSKYGNKYKIAENIASIYMCQVGQDDNFDLVMLGFDGSAKSLFMLEEELLKEINVKEINVKYAINVVPYNNGAGTYGIVDINGNIITQ